MKTINFIDEAKIKIKSGNGGNGSSVFHQEKYVEHGGPSGGNGGNGGSIYFVASRNENTLLNFKGKKHYKAENGVNGARQKMTGANGKDLFINVPVGTEVIINEDKKLDLTFDGQVVLVQKGGRGGRGNASFKSSKNTAPTLYENGEVTKELDIMLNLKILADVGILGFPNIGKSTFVSTISNAKPEISNYEFTTLTPHLGMVNHNDFKFVITDLPGLIEGAYKGKGMGYKFLKHLSRTKLILHFIDGENLDYKDKYKKLRNELKLFSKNISLLEEIIIISKSDLIDDEIKEHIKSEFKRKKIFFISSFTKEGLNEVLNEIVKKLIKINKKIEENDEKQESEYVKITFEEKDILADLKISRENDVWELSGEYVEYWGNKIPLTSYENYYRIIKKLKSKGIIKKLKSKGINYGDYLTIKNTPFMIEFNDENN